MASEKRKKAVCDFITYKNMLEKEKADNLEDEIKYRGELDKLALEEVAAEAELRALQKAYATAYGAKNEQIKGEIGGKLRHHEKHVLVRLELKKETLQNKLQEIEESNIRIREKGERASVETGLIVAECNRRLNKGGG